MDKNVEKELNKTIENEWKKCFSKKRGIDYYFNPKTGLSFWTLDEVKQYVIGSADTQAMHLDEPEPEIPMELEEIVEDVMKYKRRKMPINFHLIKQI
jgi:hypothetical protein